VIDSMTVVRLKRGLLPSHPRADWGSRTDYLCARSPCFDQCKYPFWLLKDTYANQNTLRKPTTGLCAVLEVRERFPGEEIFVIGFDRLMHPEMPDPPHTWLAHDKWAEHELMMKLGVKELGQVHRM
jgi:hypothetical protein